MELEDIKANWQEISNKLEKSEALNKTIIVNLAKKSVRSTKEKLERFEYFFLILSLICIAFNIMGIAVTDGIAIKYGSLCVFLSVFVLAAVWQGYKIHLLHKIDNERCTMVELIERTTRFKFLTQARVIVGMILLIPILALIIYLQREMLTSDMLWGALIGGLTGALMGLRATAKHWKNINNLLADLKELGEYERV